MSNILCAGDTFSYNLWVASCYEMWHCDAKLALCLAGLWHLPGKRSACGIYHAFWWAMAEWLILSLYWQLVLTTQPLTQALRQVVKVPTQWINHNRKSLLLPWRVSLWVLFLCLFGLRLGCGGPGAKADHCWSWSTGEHIQQQMLQQFTKVAFGGVLCHVQGCELTQLWLWNHVGKDRNIELSSHQGQFLKT